MRGGGIQGGTISCGMTLLASDGGVSDVCECLFTLCRCDLVYTLILYVTVTVW